MWNGYTDEETIMGRPRCSNQNRKDPGEIAQVQVIRNESDTFKTVTRSRTLMTDQVLVLGLFFHASRHAGLCTRLHPKTFTVSDENQSD